ncbi:hypothetical protein DN752_20995 [Echinicola strongylocentroti]|uniref:N-acetyltransferase domain-containing protein n=1 Tax=Echinicola strongylocentroti TaxID=1795355 RepID=A0A2Z4INT8_9BACT|nr:GNAT family N-acetyltransferase [Echinicola strongylocentroti]AWW32420.1 hypothetical protein DN752_20995 [Echinicola strongylocentroti]
MNLQLCSTEFSQSIRNILNEYYRYDDDTLFGSFERLYPALEESRLWIFEKKEQVVCYAKLNKSFPSLEIVLFETLPKFRNKGNGSYFLKLIEEEAKCQGFKSLKIQPVNASDRWWKKRGLNPNNRNWAKDLI